VVIHIAKVNIAVTLKRLFCICYCCLVHKFIPYRGWINSFWYRIEVFVHAAVLIDFGQKIRRRVKNFEIRTSPLSNSHQLTNRHLFVRGDALSLRVMSACIWSSLYCSCSSSFDTVLSLHWSLLVKDAE